MFMSGWYGGERTKGRRERRIAGRDSRKAGGRDIYIGGIRDKGGHGRGGRRKGERDGLKRRKCRAFTSIGGSK